MLTGFRHRSTFSPIGMDLGRRGIRLVQLVRQGTAPRKACGSGEPWKLFKAFYWDGGAGRGPSGAGGGKGVTPDNGEPVNDHAVTAALRSADGCYELGEQIKRALRQNEFREKDLVIGLSSPEVELHALELPVPGQADADEGVRQAARWEIERLMTFAQGTVSTDFWLLPMANSAQARRAKTEHGGPQNPEQPTAIGVAAEMAVVSGVWRMCQAAGVVCRRLDVGLCALSRFGAWLRGWPDDRAGRTGTADESTAPEIWGLLDMGDHQARLAVCLGDVPVLVRGFDAGGQRWIRCVSETLGLSFAAAEIHLRDHGIQAPVRGGTDQGGRGVRCDDRDVPSAQLGGIIRGILREDLDALCGEIEQSYRYALQCYPGHRVAELMLVGGGAELRGLDEYLKARLGIEVCSAARRWEATGLATAEAASVRQRDLGAPFPGKGAGGRRLFGELACAVGLAIPADGPRWTKPALRAEVAGKAGPTG
ncbi:MAG: hypothetical protein V2A79_14265 [Planctomycetota bacterium]